MYILLKGSSSSPATPAVVVASALSNISITRFMQIASSNTPSKEAVHFGLDSFVLAVKLLDCRYSLRKSCTCMHTYEYIYQNDDALMRKLTFLFRGFSVNSVLPIVLQGRHLYLLNSLSLLRGTSNHFVYV